ncbi:hypothetical protein D3C85_1887420 [compost metagenome]
MPVTPVPTVLRIAPQVLPGQGKIVQVQNIEIGRGGIPLLVIDHTTTSLCTWGSRHGLQREAADGNTSNDSIKTD